MAACPCLSKSELYHRTGQLKAGSTFVLAEDKSGHRTGKSLFGGIIMPVKRAGELTG